jgi:hypothetical protein
MQARWSSHGHGGEISGRRGAPEMFLTKKPPADHFQQCIKIYAIRDWNELWTKLLPSQDAWPSFYL